uniref:Tetratricopeptide repeat protein n=1 Tax=Ignavibacterium album TaxID=591197 RepID=A0A7V2ZMC7_9BACT
METFNSYNEFILSDPVQKRKLAEFFNCKGVEQADEGNLIEALNYFNKALQIDPMCKEALFNRATIKADLGKIDEARKDFYKTSLINFPETPESKIQSLITNQTSKINFY